MKKLFLTLSLVLWFICVESVSAHTVKVINFNKYATNAPGISWMFLQPGLEEVELDPSFVWNWNYWHAADCPPDNLHDYQVCFYNGAILWGAQQIGSDDPNLWPAFQTGMGSAFLICGFGWILRLAKLTGGSYA